MTANKQDPNAWIETLLAAHPAETPEGDFTAKVMARIAREQRRRYVILAPFFIAAFVLLLGFFPYQMFEGAGRAVAFRFAEILPYLLPVGAAAVMFLFSMFSEEVA